MLCQNPSAEAAELYVQFYTIFFPPSQEAASLSRDFPRFLPLTFTDETVNPGSATPASVCQICFQALRASTCGKHAVSGGSKVAGVACSRTSIRSRTPISGFFFFRNLVLPQSWYPTRSAACQMFETVAPSEQCLRTITGTQRSLDLPYKIGGFVAKVAEIQCA